jgi:imidazolonepropionase-like amidohydrolase
MKSILTIQFILILSFCAYAQNHFNTNGVHSKNTPNKVFYNTTLHISGEEVIEKGMLIIKDNKIIYAGGKTKIPENSIQFNLDGKHIYPSFIELESDFGIAEQKKNKSTGPQYNTSKKGAYYWNEAIRTEDEATQQFTYDEKDAIKLRKLGFGTVLTHIHNGISRGSGSLVTLNEKPELQLQRAKSSSHYSFQKGTSRQAYPSSQMGAIALLKQYFYDALYHEKHFETEKVNLTLEAFIANQSLPAFFDIRDKLAIFRAEKIANEFNLNFNYIGNGDEYQEVQALKSSITSSLIIPINFPKPYDVEDPFDAMYVSLAELKHWEMAPSNPYILEKEALSFAITSKGIDKEKEFLNNLRLAVKRGLSPALAINSLTIIPATILNQDKNLGSLVQGKIANFIITSSDILDNGATINENWVQGSQYIIKSTDQINLLGEYNLNVNQIIRTLKVTGSTDKPKGELEYKIVSDSVSETGDLVIDKITGKPIKVTKDKKVKVSISAEKDFINISYPLAEGTYRLSGNINYDSGSWDGKGQSPTGEWMDWTAIRKEKTDDPTQNKTTEHDTVVSAKFNYPMMAYGWDSLPKSQPVLIKNATVWTNEEAGKIQTDVLLRNGKIAAIAKILDVVDQSTIVIDGTGMHLTPGIIDEHSHISIARGVNEGSHAITAEVRIGDVLKNDDINIYRQLAGGVTACQLLHGSANPVGGQSALIKLRWGLTPEEMKIDGADEFIKFALGENVKQSNWGARNNIRFPQTRMGVEQVYYDAFIRAKEYEQTWKNYEKESSKKKNNAVAPKRDIQLDALLEIVNSERFITCHSYVQSEINMLMHVADSMGFTINTFTHILEGYKLADKMKTHGVGASTFSDWWAYKYEVNDAIPYNASLLNQMDIVTAINSDDAEMGRRLNQEAAKGVKYGGMTEEQALKMVTLNPAKLLHLDERMGSIKEGKDADVVLWSDNPLSIYAKVQYTIIDGIIYFDHEKDVKMQTEIQKESARIINKMIEAKNGGSETQKVVGKKQRTHICTSIDEDEQ